MNNETSEQDVYALQCIRVRVRGLIGQKLVRYDEFDDICHEVYCEFLKRRNRFDAARGCYSTFTSSVIRNLIASLAHTRYESRGRSSFTQISDTTLSASSPGAHFSRSTVDVLNLQIAVKEAVNALPDRLRWLANALCSQTLTEISDSSGKPRSSLYEQRAEIRWHLERFGLKPLGRESLIRKSPDG